jgi:hypothetical protein
MISFEEILAIAGGRPGHFDVACPACGPDRAAPSNRIRRVLRLYVVDETFAGYCCVRCGAKGNVRPHGGQSRPIDREALAAARTDAERRLRLAAVEGRTNALRLWRRRIPIAGTIADRYLREVRQCRGEVPATIAFLPAGGPHPPAMIAAFGVPAEPEPGILSIPDDSVRGVHLTRLRPDGSKSEPPAKIMIGPSLGAPLVLAPMNDLLGLAIVEGIEDALSVTEATGLGVWAAGSASRLPALARALPSYADCVSIIADADEAGRRHAGELLQALRSRAIRASLIELRSRVVVA